MSDVEDMKKELEELRKENREAEEEDRIREELKREKRRRFANSFLGKLKRRFERL